MQPRLASKLPCIKDDLELLIFDSISQMLGLEILTTIPGLICVIPSFTSSFVVCMGRPEADSWGLP